MKLGFSCQIFGGGGEAQMTSGSRVVPMLTDGRDEADSRF
jgi:hypothetical protein